MNANFNTFRRMLRADKTLNAIENNMYENDFYKENNNIPVLPCVFSMQDPTVTISCPVFTGRLDPLNFLNADVAPLC